MKKEATKKSKLWIWLVVGIVALLAVAGVVLAMVMGGSEGPAAEGPKGGRADLYWNVDRTTYTENSESGLSTREPGEDGIYRVRYAYNGSLVELEIADKQLVNYIDTMDCMGIVQDADGVVIDVVDPKTIATETARMFYVRATGEGKITLNSSMAMNGMNMDIELKDVTEVYDVSAKAETPGMKVDPATLQSMDSVTVYSNDLGEATHVYVISHPVESPVYWRADKNTYNSTEKKTTRVPDAEGYYTIPFFVNGERVELKCNIEGIVNTIDAKNRFKAHTGLVLDEEGHIVDNMLAATGIRGLLGCEMFDVTAINGNTFTAEGLLAGKGEVYEGTLAADAVIYDVSEQAKPDVRGKAVDSLKIGDRIVVFENTDGEVIQVYIGQRMLDLPMYFNVTKKYSSANKSTTRTPDGNGWYYIEMMSEGVIKTYKTKDINLINEIDSRSHRSVALELDGDIITYVYDGEAVAGYGAHVGYSVVSTTGSIISISAPNNPDNIVNRILGADCKIYNMSGVKQEKGELTTLQVGDYCIMWRNARSEIVYVYVIRRVVDAPIYFSITRKWNSTKEETTREPDENGWYVYECITEAKKVTVKTKSKTVANFLDSQSPQTFALQVDKDGVIYEYYETAAVTGGNRAYLNHIVKRLDVLVTYYPTTGKTYTPTLAEDCRIYNYSQVYEKARGERTTLQLEDSIQCYTNLKGEIAVILVRQRKITADVYFSKNRVKTVDENGHTTRQPDADGWYVFQCALKGKEVTVKTKDIEVATMMDAQSPQAFALKVDKNGVIQKAYPATAATGGSTRALNAKVTKVDGNNITVMLSGTDTLFEMPMASKYEVYNVSDNYDDHWGEATKIKVGDTLQSYTDSSNKIVLVYVRTRPGDLRMAWVVNQQYDKTNKVSLRKPDADGLFTVELAINGEVKEYKVSGQKVINYIDSANGAVAVTFKGGVIINAQSAIYGPGIWTNTQAAVIATVQSVDGDKIVVKKSDGTTLEITKAPEFVCYDVSGKAEFIGQAATPKAGDYGRMYLNTSKQAMFFYIMPAAGSSTSEPEKPVIKEYSNAALTFEAGTTKAQCTYCGKVVEWTALEPAVGVGIDLADGGHYYLAEDMTANTMAYSVGSKLKACVHLNGHNITSTGRAFVNSNDAKLVIMGNGVVTGSYNNASDVNTAAATVSSRGELILIGGTYKHTNSVLPTIIQSRPQKTMEMYKDVTVEGTEGVTGSNVYVRYGIFNMYGGTITGGTATPAGTTQGKGDNIYVYGWTGSTGARAEFNMYGGLVDGGIYAENYTAAFKVSVSGDSVITANKGGLHLDTATEAKLTIGELGADAKIYVTGQGPISVSNTNASSYVGSKILPAYDTLTLKVEDNVIIASGEIPAPSEPVAEPVWKMAWVVDPEWNDTDKVTKRTPDADGYYFVELSIDGVTKTYKTKATGLDGGIDYVDQSGNGNRSVAIQLVDKDSVEFTVARGATNHTGAKSAVVGDVISIEDGVITVEKSDKSTWSGKVAAAGQVFDVSDKAVVEGEPTTLMVGDNIRIYNDADGNILYGYVYTRTAEPEREPVPTWKMAFCATPMFDATNKVTTRTPDADGYYYIDLSIDGVTKTYKTKQTGLDSNGNGIDYADQCANSKRPFAVYLTDVDSTEFMNARSALYAPESNKAGNSGVLITEINGKVITGTKGSDTLQDTMADNVEIYDISSYATVKGEVASLEVGYTYRTYVNADGEARYIFITARPEPAAEPVPTWKMAWVVDPEWNDTDKVTKRTPDADGYYYIDLSIEGVTKTYKTKTRGLEGEGNGIDYADQSGEKNRAISVYLTDVDSVEFTLAKSATINTGARGAKVGTLKAVEGTTVTFDDDTVLKLADDAKLYDVSNNAVVEGEPTTLKAGDNLRVYTDADGDILYAYVYTRTAAPEPEPEPTVSYTDNLVFAEGTTDAMCPVCEKVVTWTALTTITKTTDLEDGKHYYLAEDLLENTGRYRLETGTVCVHLNGHDVKSTGNRVFAIMANQTMNIMGNGTVSGSATNTTAATIYSAGWLNLYAGTYTAFDSESAVLSQQKSQKGITIYKDATVTAISDAEGSAVNVVFGNLTVNDATVTGNVYVKGLSGTTKVTSHVTLNNAAVTGEIVVANYASGTDVTVTGAAVADVNLVEKVLLSVGELTGDADIKVTATGAFTAANENVQKYVDDGLITAKEEGKTISVTDGVASIVDATAAKVYDNSDLVFEEGTTKAMCPWCGEVKEWTAISEDLTTTLTLSANGHYYLAKDLQNTSRINVASESVACMHLNGHNITTTGNRAISVQKDGLLSVMGNGIVSGSGTAESTYGATVSCAGSMNLIGGTYKHFDSTLPTVSQNRATGTANIYQDVTFQADENVTGSHVFLAFGTLNVYGTTISGGVPGSLTDGKGGNIAAMATVANATTEVHLYDAVIDGGIYMANKTYTVLTLNGTVKVSNKDGGITTDELLTLGQMKKGAEVFVTAADGAFTVASDRAADYLAYGWIKPADETKTITENAGVLSIG